LASEADTSTLWASQFIQLSSATGGLIGNGKADGKDSDARHPVAGKDNLPRTKNLQPGLAPPLKPPVRFHDNRD